MRHQYLLQLFVIFLTSFGVTSAHAEGDSTPLEHAFFIGVKDGDTVHSPLKIGFGVTGMTIAPAGTDTPNTGHFHLLIDTEMSSEQLKAAIPSDAHHVHFGKGQQEAEITLSPGKHQLQLLLGDGKHIPHHPPIVSHPITVTVQ